MSDSNIDPFSDQYLVDDGDPNPALTIYIGVVGVVLTVVIVLLLTAMFNNVLAEEEERKRIAVVPAEREAVWEAQRGELSGYEWVDQASGVVSLPIDRAVDLVLEERIGSE